MMPLWSRWRSWATGFALCLAAGVANANPTLVIDVDSGEVLYHQMAAAPWFPASLTKLMTTYVALSKVREGKISLDTPLRVSRYAATMAPSKMGFRPGTLVTLDNALKMLMVKSPNDIAVTVAEGISGSVPAFAADMNAYGARLGLHESHFDNPNGLPDEQHISSARDMAMIGRALFREFPENHDLFGIPALQFGGRIINNHNNLIGRYPGVDGMKTGYTCSAGYNVVASAQRGNKHLIVVIMGAPSGRERSERAASLFEKYFSDPGSGMGDVAALPASEIVLPPDLRGQICGPGRRDAIAEAAAEDADINLAPAGVPMFGRAAERQDLLGMATGTTAVGAAGVTMPGGKVQLLGPRAAFDPVKVFVGPAAGYTGTIAGPIEDSAPGPKATRTAKADAKIDAPDVALPAGEALPAPLALAGATPPAAAIVAANKAVKSKGRLSLRVSRKVEVEAKKTAAKPAVVKTSVEKPAPAKRAAKPVAEKPKAKTAKAGKAGKVKKDKASEK